MEKIKVGSYNAVRRVLRFDEGGRAFVKSGNGNAYVRFNKRLGCYDYCPSYRADKA